MKMKKALLFTIVIMMAVTAAKAQNISGTWKGVLTAGQQELGLVFHFNNDDVTMDVPEQGATGIPAEVKLLSNDSVSIEVPAIQMSYSGKLSDGIIKGTFKQFGMSFPLDLKPGEVQKPSRPQEPQGPFDYATEEVTFTNDKANVTLSGTLTYPVGYSGKKKTPVVIMVTGSGAQNRDEEVFEHKPFLVIADYFARQGIASLRYDDRGVEKSTGDRANCTSEDYADDARAGLEWLKKSNKFDKIGVVGHSEGGMIAFMLAAENVPDFIISLAGPGIKGDTLLAEQQSAALRLYGQSADVTVEMVRKEIESQPDNAWLNFFLDYDPQTDIAKIKIPVMAVNGSNDMQVIANSNLDAISKLLSGKNKKNLIKEYPYLNHLFQHCQKNNALDYYKTEETFSEEVMKDMADWINGL